MSLTGDFPICSAHELGMCVFTQHWEKVTDTSCGLPHDQQATFRALEKCLGCWDFTN